MKKILLLPTLLFVVQMSAQDSINKPFTFSVKAGAAFSDAETTMLYDNGRSLTKNRTSFYAGVEAEYKFCKWVGVALGAEYVELGAKNTGDSYDEVNISEIVVPLSFKIYPVEHLYFQAGGYAGFNVTTKVKTFPYDDDTPAYIKTDVDYGVLFGVGGTYNHFFIEAKYNLGLNNILSWDKSKFEPNFDPIIDGGLSEPHYKNRFLQIGVGYKF